MQVSGEIERKVTLGREGAEVEGSESPEEAIRKFHARFMKLVDVLRPRCSTPGKYLCGSLSKADPYQKRIQQNLLGSINRRQGIVRTKMIESLTCIFAFAVS